MNSQAGDRVHAVGEGLDLRRNGFVTFRMGDQWLGIPVVLIQEVFTGERVSPVPLSPPAVHGFLNLRGQIVTAVELRAVLGLEPRTDGGDYMNIVIRDEEELFALLVDEVGDVVEVAEEEIEPAPRTLGSLWKKHCNGVVRLERGLLVILEVEGILGVRGGEVLR